MAHVFLMGGKLLNQQDLEAYFERISYQGRLDVSIESLRGLVAAHVFHIPFENLDIHMGRKINLDAESMLQKLVYQRRGGYCYEMNGLFALVLETLGFQVDRLMGRILFGVTEIRPRSHQISLVHLDNQAWLVDVGYGARNLLAPLLLQDGHSESQYSEKYRMIQENADWFAVQGDFDGEWKSFYSFTREKHLPVDYTFANYFNSTSPDSRFVQYRMIALPNACGRVSLVDNLLKISENGQITERGIESLDDYRAALEQYFGIVLPNDVISWFAEKI